MIVLFTVALLAAPVSLPEALARGADAPGAQAADHRAEAAAAAARATGRAALLPVVGVQARLDGVHEPRAVTTPVGALAVEPGRTLAVGLEVRQPLFDPAGLLYATPAAEADARAARHGAARARQIHAALAADAWLGVKAVDARQATAASYVASLKARRDQLAALVGEGVALRADLLRVELALSQAEEEVRGLARQRAVATRQLGRAIGQDGPVEVAGDARLPTFPATAERPEIAALAARIEATGHREDAALGELLPRLEAYGRYTAASTDLEDRAWLEGGVALTWIPLAAGTRGPREDAAQAEGRALRAEAADLARAIATERAAAEAALADALDQQAVAAEAIVEAEESLRLEQARYDDARATLTELLAAEATIRDRRTRLALAGLAAIRAQVQLALATGALQPDDLQGGSADPRGKIAPEGGEG
ncbi:MAG: TolC family protein [bacterium]